ncbi:hypothetical protein ACFQ9X_03715 [Catenulispora yoronensis]
MYGDPRTVRTPLDAELWASAFLGGLWTAALQQDDEPEGAELGLVEVLELVGSPRTQAVLCAVASVASPAVAGRAAEASERLFRKGCAVRTGTARPCSRWSSWRAGRSPTSSPTASC